MLARYPATYRDKNGEEATTIENDGKRFRMIVRGVPFEGPHVGDLEPAIPYDSPQLTSFTLWGDPAIGVILIDYAVEYDAPIPVMADEEIRLGRLHVAFDMRMRDERGRLIDYLRLTLHFNGKAYAGRGGHSEFETELLAIQKALPEGVYMKACINCLFSDYCVYGNEIFGGMLCYRDNRAQYLAVKSKREYMKVYATEQVQETYLCPEFQRRIPGTGYRG
jgi:hypothetical protein